MKKQDGGERMNIVKEIIKDIVEDGEVEIRIRLTGKLTVREALDKAAVIATNFSKDEVRIVRVKQLKEEEELEAMLVG